MCVALCPLYSVQEASQYQKIQLIFLVNQQVGCEVVGRLDTPLEIAHRLLQHLENHQPRVNALQNEIAQLQSIQMQTDYWWALG